MGYPFLFPSPNVITETDGRNEFTTLSFDGAVRSSKVIPPWGNEYVFIS
jgi:hypothetical protein